MPWMSGVLPRLESVHGDAIDRTAGASAELDVGREPLGVSADAMESNAMALSLDRDFTLGVGGALALPTASRGMMALRFAANPPVEPTSRRVLNVDHFEGPRRANPNIAHIYDDSDGLGDALMSVDAPRLPPPPTTGPAPVGVSVTTVNPVDKAEARGTVYDAQDFLHYRLGLKAGDSLKLFHKTNKPFGRPGERTEIKPVAGGNGYGPGFYTSTIPEPGYGASELDLDIPFEAFAGERIFHFEEWINGGDFAAPRGVGVFAANHEDRFWFVFRHESLPWLNQVAVKEEFSAGNQ